MFWLSNIALFFFFASTESFTTPQSVGITKRRHQHILRHASAQKMKTRCCALQDKEIFLDGGRLTEASDFLIQTQQTKRGREKTVWESTNEIDSIHATVELTCSSSASSRRQLFASALMGVGTAIAATKESAHAFSTSVPYTMSDVAPDSSLSWQITPVNKRTGVTVFDAEQSGYSVPFVTYLSRFLLSFDRDCRRWWYNRANDIPRTATADQVNAARLEQFAAFSASVEVGLQEFQGSDGPKRFLASMIRRYCPTIEEIQQSRVAAGQAPLSSTEKVKEEREIKEARRQIVLLFGLMEKNQPVQELRKQLAIIDNGRVIRGELLERKSGFSRDDGPFEVQFPEPDAGSNYEKATGKAILRPNGRLLRIDVTNPGNQKFAKPPEIIISPPASLADSSNGTISPQPEGMAAQAQAVLYRSGPNKGRVEKIQLTKPGSGYTEAETISVEIRVPDVSQQDDIETATATAILDYEISGVEITNSGSGYVAESLLDFFIESPKGLIKGLAYPLPENNKGIFAQFRKDDDQYKALKIPQQVSGAVSTGDVPVRFNFGGGSNPSSQLLSLLPSGIGLKYDPETRRYVLAVDPNYQENTPRGLKTSTVIDPDFGPRGRAPIEREMELGLAAYLRFVASGAICCSAVHLAVTPIDVVKTKVQSDPVKYPGVIQSFGRVLKEEGIEGLAQGWLPTFVGFFFAGGVAYAMTEYLRRVGTASLGDVAPGLEVPIVIAAAGAAAAIGSVVICPFESVRIRSVSDKDYAPNIFAVLFRMIEEEGVPSLFQAVPGFLGKEVPFAMAKFSVFDVSTKWMYELYPVAKESVQLSLTVSLLGGIIGGLCAAVVSNPADVAITTMKKSKSSLGPLEAAAIVMEKGGGPRALFTGLQLRMIFYALVVSLQFLLYDSIKFLLGVGSDDLKLYLDVLGGALQETGGPL